MSNLIEQAINCDVSNKRPKSFSKRSASKPTRSSTIASHNSGRTTESGVPASSARLQTEARFLA